LISRSKLICTATLLLALVAVALAPSGAVGRAHSDKAGPAAPAPAPPTPAPPIPAPRTPAPPAPAQAPLQAHHHGDVGGDQGNGGGQGNGGQGSGDAGAGQASGDQGKGNGGDQGGGHGHGHGGDQGRGQGNGQGNGKDNGGNSNGKPTAPTPAPTPVTAAPIAVATSTPISLPTSAAPAAASTPIFAPTPATPASPAKPSSTASTVSTFVPIPGSATQLFVPSGRSAGNGAGSPSGANAASVPGGGTPGLRGPLAPATALIGPHSGEPSHSPASRHSGHGGSNPSSSATSIERFISIIPTAVWIALAVLFAAAVVATGAAVRSGRRARKRLDEVAAATSVALTDVLTGLLNRRGFTAQVDQELERARRYGHPLALAFVDVRGLKAVNDSQGHLAGDRLLRDVAQLLTASARTYDIVGRIGGDEMALLLPEQAAGGVAAMAERIRHKVPGHRAALGVDANWDLTIGTSVFPEDGEDFDSLLATADRRLYEQRGIHIR